MNTLCLHGAEGRGVEKEGAAMVGEEEEEEVHEMEEGYGVKAANN